MFGVILGFQLAAGAALFRLTCRAFGWLVVLFVLYCVFT